jgi:hypothetical protein
MKNILAFILIVSVVGVGQAYSQSRKNITVSGLAGVSGKKPSGGVRVGIKGTNRTTQTDSKGHYKLSDVPMGSTLVYSHIDAQNMEVPVGNHKAIVVSLASKNSKVKR